LENTISFWLVVILLAAWPLILVALFAMSRRFPSGMPPRRRWTVWAALALFYLVGSVYLVASGARVRGLSFVALAIAAMAYALHQRRRTMQAGSIS